MARRDPGARRRMEVSDARAEVEAAQAGYDRCQRDYGARRGSLRQVAKRLWALQAELWARIAHNMRVDAREELMADPLAARAALGGLAACERWFRRGLVLALRMRLKADGVVRETRLVEWRTKTEGTAAPAREPWVHAIYSDGTRRPTGTRADALRKAEAAWRVRAIGGRGSLRRGQPRDVFADIPPALRLAPVGVVRRPRCRPDIYLAPLEGDSAREDGGRPHACSLVYSDAPRHYARGLPAVEVTPDELGWTEAITGDDTIPILLTGPRTKMRGLPQVSVKPSDTPPPRREYGGPASDDGTCEGNAKPP